MTRDRWVIALFVAFGVLIVGALALAATDNRDAAVFVAIVAVVTTLALRIRLQVLARRDLRDRRSNE